MIPPTRNAWIAGIVLLAGLGGCARQGAPTGGPEDRRPPLVISVEPDTFAVVEPGLDRFRVRFNERISERSGSGDLASAVVISPEVEEVEVEHHRTSLEIHVRGGLAPGRVYTIRILPEIQDMFGNPMAVPFEWAVSTGGQFTENAVVGQVWDRATGDFLDGVRVVLTPDTGVPEGGAAEAEGALNYAVTSGQEGLFALRLLPEGPFRILAFQDRNSDRILDPTEPVGSTADSLGPADTLFLSLHVLLPDSTPAVLAQGEVLDSMVVRLLFDDFVDPTVELDGVAVSLSPDTTAAADPIDSVLVAALPEDLPGVARLFHEGGWAEYRDSLRIVRDSLLLLAVEEALAAGDTAGAAMLASAGIEPLPGESQPGGRPTGDPTAILPDGTPVPQPSIVLLLDGPLPPEAPVRILLSGVVNLNGLPAGGGEASVRWSPTPADTVSADSLAAPPDTAAAPDTGRVGTLPEP
ncbi:MAG: Ig-like domain-containing protein [Gemmatimonadales bacterium]|nr:MAG: Ig-like domain-containing protein [Gemmatimonadales bacterium]